MTNSRLISHAVRLATVAVLTLGATSFAADPLQPNAVTQLRLLQPPIPIPSMRVGVFDLHPQISAGVTYDDNVALSKTDTRADWIWSVTPRLSAVADNMADGYGTSLTVEYAPTFQMFTQHSEDDSINQHAQFAASWVGSKLSLGLSQSFDQTDGGVAEVGERLRQRQYTTVLSTRYKLGERTSVELNPRLSIGETEDSIGYWEYAADTFVNRVITSKITGSLGGSFGYVDPSDGPIQNYQRALGRFAYALSGKVQLEATGGVEWRQFDSDHGNTATPVFGVSAAYRPFEGTTITLEARRREDISVALTNEDYTVTGVTLGVRQRVFDRLHITLAGSYDNRDYHASDAGVNSGRNDDIYLLRAGIGANFGRHWTVDIFYQYYKDNSNVPTNGFTDNQFGLLATWKM